MNMRLLADERDRRLVGRLVGHVVLAFLGAAVGLIAVRLMSLSGGPSLTASTSLWHALGVLFLCVGVVLMMRVIVAVTRDG